MFLEHPGMGREKGEKTPDEKPAKERFWLEEME